MTPWAARASLLALAVALVGACGKADRNRPQPPSEAGAAGDVESTLDCAIDDDCLAVLDTRHQTDDCYYPRPATHAQLAADPCLVPWLSDPKCSIPPPDPMCTEPISPPHPCPAAPRCAEPACHDGKCSITFPATCPELPRRDCETLRQEYVRTLTDARACTDVTDCTGNLADTCGCAVPYNISGALGDSAFCAFDVWRNAGCPIVDCGATGACLNHTTICRVSEGASMGVCEYSE